MFDEENEAYKMGRIRKKIRDRQKRAFEKVFHSEDGRVFLGYLMAMGYLYEEVDSEEAEGARRLVLNIRKTAQEYNLLPQWRKAEEEQEDFQASIELALKQEDEDGQLSI
jgi:sulfite reductase beta subunit-like hemoprotein